MSDFENDNDSLLSDDNNINFIEEIENSYKIYINLFLIKNINKK